MATPSANAAQVNVNIASFIFANNGATVTGSPSFGHVMTGAPTTCPSGAFDAAVTVPGGCTEAYRLMGAFTGVNTWNATFTMTFTAGCEIYWASFRLISF